MTYQHTQKWKGAMSFVYSVIGRMMCSFAHERRQPWHWKGYLPLLTHIIFPSEWISISGKFTQDGLRSSVLVAIHLWAMNVNHMNGIIYDIITLACLLIPIAKTSPCLSSTTKYFVFDSHFYLVLASKQASNLRNLADSCHYAIMWCFIHD